MTGMPHVHDVRDVRRALRLVARATTPRTVTAEHLAENGISREGAGAVRALLESLDFVSADGAPTSTWADYRDGTDPTAVLACAMREVYGELLDDPEVDTSRLAADERADVVATFTVLCELAGRRGGGRRPANVQRPRRDVVSEVSRLLQTSVAEFDAARGCLERDLTRQAVTSAWSSLAALAFAHLSPDDFGTLRTSATRSSLAPVDLMRSVDDAELLTLLGAAGLVDADEAHALASLLARHEDAAHPALAPPGRDEAAAYLSSVLECAYALTQHPLTQHPQALSRSVTGA